MTAADSVVYSRPFGRAALAPVAAWGYRRHLRSGQTPRAAYSAMRKLYGNADPRLFEALAGRAATERPLLSLADAPGVAEGEIDRAVAALGADGYVVLDHALDEASCADLEAVARSASCRLIGPSGTPARGRFDPDAPIAVRYDLDEEEILTSSAAQRLVADASLLAIAQRYLGAAPIQDLVAMWWSAAVDGGAPAADAAAQQYHFDLDRLRFLKVFVYLTDVGDDQGPHGYVRGSHRTKPPALRTDGHADAEVAAAYPGDEVQITGRRGTIFIADTLGLHKGMPVREGHRLVFQTEYTTSLFGAPFTRPEVRHPVPLLAEQAARFPEAFGRFRLGPPSTDR